MKSVLFFCGVILLMGCNPLENSHDSIAIECSIPAHSQGRYLKIQSPEGQSFQGEVSKRLQSQFITDSGVKTVVTVTAGGCVELPQESGVLTVVDTYSKQSLTQRVLPTNSNQPLTKENLQDLRDFSLTLNCPAEGLYADEFLQSPENLTLNGDIKGLEFHLDLYNSGNQFIRRLFDKNLGSSDANHIAKISVADLPEGNYSLRLYGRHVANGIYATPALLNAEKTCPLYVLHGDVKVKGLNVANPRVVAKNTSMDWKPQKSGEQLYICKEARNNCQAKSCLDQNGFEKVDDITADQAGIFDYYVFAKNQLGRKSPVSCQTVIVSDSKPTMSLEWEAEDLKKPGSVLRMPYAVIKAHTQLNHSLVDNETLEMNLQCKVSFEIRGRDELSGNSVICTEGRCKGKPMGQFVPCDADIGFSLVEAWEQPLISSSRLLLKVRSSDGAGHEIEGESSFWINKSTWKTDILDFKFDDKDWSVQSFAISKSGIPVAAFSDGSFDGLRIARYVNDRWELLIPDFSRAHFFHFNKSQDGSISALASYYTDNSGYLTYEYLKLDDEGRIATRTDVNNNFAYGCDSFNIDKSNRLWCFYSAESFVYFTGTEWVKLPDYSNLLGPEEKVGIVDPWLIASDDRLWLIGGDFLLVYSESQGWIRIDLQQDLKKSRLVNIVEDYKGRIWLISRNLFEGDSAALQLLENGRLKEYPSTEPLNGSAHSYENLQQATLRNSLQFDFQNFNFADDTWSNLNPGIKISEDFFLRETKHLLDGSTVLAYDNHGFFVQKETLVYWPLNNLGFNSWGMQSIHNVKDEFYFLSKTGVNFKLARLKINKASLFDESMVEFHGIYSTDAWQDSSGRVVFAMGNGSLLQMNDDKIQKLPIHLPKNTYKVFPLSGDRYCLWLDKSLMIVDGNHPMRPAYENSGTGPSFIYNQCSEDAQGRIWFYSDTLGFVDSEKQFHPLFKAFEESNGYMTNMTMFDGGRKIWTSTNKVIRIISTDDQSIQELALEQLLPGLSLSEIKSTWQLSENEFLIHIKDSVDQYHSLIFDYKTELLKEDMALSKLDPGIKSLEIKYRGNKAWAYAEVSNGKLALFTRVDKSWVITAGDELKPWPEVTGAPYDWSVDLMGRIWFMSNGPNYEFYRYDP